MLLLAPLCKGSRIALIVGTATRSPTLKCMYVYTIHPTGHSPLLCFLTISLNLRDSYIVKVKALANAFMYVHPTHQMRLWTHHQRETGQRYEIYLN